MDFTGLQQDLWIEKHVCWIVLGAFDGLENFRAKVAACGVRLVLNVQWAFGFESHL